MSFPKGMIVAKSTAEQHGWGPCAQAMGSCPLRGGDSF